MPSVKIEGPELKDMETKRALAKEITDVMEKIYKMPRSGITVTIV